MSKLLKIKNQKNTECLTEWLHEEKEEIGKIMQHYRQIKLDKELKKELQERTFWFADKIIEQDG